MQHAPPDPQSEKARPWRRQAPSQNQNSRQRNAGEYADPQLERQAGKLRQTFALCPATARVIASLAFYEVRQ